VRVNITYSVELEEVPTEISRILEECAVSSRKFHGDLDRAIGRKPLEMLEDIDTLRVSLAKMDLKLADAMQILSGYAQTLAKKPEMEQRAIQEQEQRIAALAAQLSQDTSEELDEEI